MPAKTEKEAADYFLNYLQETVSCVTNESLTAYSRSKKLYKVWFNPAVELSTRSGQRLFMSITQVFGVVADPSTADHFKVKTREYSYRLSHQIDVNRHDILSYHWHPNDSDLRDPHLHITAIARVHFPTSRVCIEDFIWLAIQYYGVRPTMKKSEWTAILDKNKKAFDRMATWKIKPINP